MEGVVEAPSGAWIETFTGGQFFLEDPQPEDVCIEDIAHALSQVCRFAGHVRRFYSVAEHSLLVMENLPLKFQAWGLLHDAAEAYVGDVSRPLKGTLAMEPYRKIEDRILQCILARFGLDWHGDGELPPQVKEVDLRALVTEHRDLMPKTDNEWSIRAEPFVKVIGDYEAQDIEEQFLRAASRLGIQ